MFNELVKQLKEHPYNFIKKRLRIPKQQRENIALFYFFPSRKPLIPKFVEVYLLIHFIKYVEKFNKQNIPLFGSFW